ncbi:MAG TPA: C40 family peptidase [Jatrophihabitans sp.]|nr:C40 family peptidase [Jatrophihabitans sp.]
MALPALAVVAASLPADAAPTTPADPASSAEAASLVAAKGHELEVVTERFNTAREQLLARQATAQQAMAGVEKAQQDLAAAQDRVRGVARSAYTGGNLGHLQALLTSSSAREFVDRLATLNSIAGRQNELLARAAAAQDTATRARLRAEQAAQAARADYDAVLKQQTDLQQQIDAYRAAFNRLSAQEQRAAQGAAGHGDSRASRADRPAAPATSSVPVAAPNGSVQTVISTALAQRGKPYVWAAAGPDSFDCSGLVQYAFRAAGVSLPHSSSMQSRTGRSVSRAEARPGDLVFFYTPVSHIGIYLGNGLQVHAPTSGDVVKVASIDGFGDTPRFTRIID